MKALTTLVVTVGAAAMMVSGCSWTQRGAVAGGAVGSAVGAGWGYAASNAISVAKLAIGGGAIGAASGALIGDQFDQAEARGSDRELENLRAQLTQRETELAQLQSQGDPRILDLEAQIQQLSSANQDMSASSQDRVDRLAQLEQETAQLREQVQAKENELASLASTVQEKSTAVDSLRGELAELNVELEETNRGLTLTILDQLLYKPGQASLSPEGTTLISSVANIIHNQFPNREIIVEGHTDNQPIRFSKWQSNWELGAARALAVVHTLVENHGFSADRISAMTFGEYRPASDNMTPEGRSLNRRSVIVILPEKVPFQKQVASVSSR